MFFETEENLVVEICYYYGLKQSLVLVRIAIMFFLIRIATLGFSCASVVQGGCRHVYSKNAHCRTLLIVHVPSLL